MSITWLLLIYTVPATPSRKRAAVWREVKRVGAVYLRDGVCILPERPDTLGALRSLADQVDAFGGQATVAQSVTLDASRAETVVAQFQAARANEYAEVAREAEQLLGHMARETKHRDFSYGELEELEQDLGKLKRWTDQVRTRDYFGPGPEADVQELFARCEAALETFLEATAEASRHR
jgi:hypothetical protein